MMTWKLRVQGIVQGVGFRPHAVRVANALGAAGSVGNDENGVYINLVGDRDTCDSFIQRLIETAPPASRVDAVEVIFSGSKDSQQQGEFVIEPSKGLGKAFGTLVSADLATCNECLAELLDPENRRFGYPFINCTQCGPRYSIIESLPYDRPRTTMAPFIMCQSCFNEYIDTVDRRFHAQPNACHECGPSYRFESVGDNLERIGASRSSGDAISDAVQVVISGGILAVKGIGGYHLITSAQDRDAVKELRRRKNRPRKAFAVMVKDLEMARQFAILSAAEERVLVSSKRPIVLLDRLDNTEPLAIDEVAPGLTTLGLILAYAPIHYLLLEQLRFAGIHAVVVTSANATGGAIISDDGEARRELPQWADGILTHNRRILNPLDDSIVEARDGTPHMIRRARGFVPDVLKLGPHPSSETVLGLGPELKSTFCLVTDRGAFIGPHVGDLSSSSVQTLFQRHLDRFTAVFDNQITIVAHDLHPQFFSSRKAAELARASELKVFAVQHHEAHIAAVVAEHGLIGDVIGIAADGTGFGHDGTIWGGEVLAGSPANLHRAWHLSTFSLPGSEVAILEPWRIGIALLESAQVGSGHHARRLMPWIPENAEDVVPRMIANGINSPTTSSAGRFLDGIAALLGFDRSVTYEGEAAIELESLANSASSTFGYQSELFENVINVQPMIQNVLNDLQNGVSRSSIAYRVLKGLSLAFADAAVRVRDSKGLNRVCLAGGVFQNRIIRNNLIEILQDRGFEVFIGEQLSCNDGSVSLGQALIARYRANDSKELQGKPKSQ